MYNLRLVALYTLPHMTPLAPTTPSLCRLFWSDSARLPVRLIENCALKILVCSCISSGRFTVAIGQLRNGIDAIDLTHNYTRAGKRNIVVWARADGGPWQHIAHRRLFCHNRSVCKCDCQTANRVRYLQACQSYLKAKLV